MQLCADDRRRVALKHARDDWEQKVRLSIEKNTEALIELVKFRHDGAVKTLESVLAEFDQHHCRLPAEIDEKRQLRDQVMRFQMESREVLGSPLV